MDLNQSEVTNTNKKVRKTKKNNKIKRLIVIVIILLILVVASIAVYKNLSKDKLSYYENKMIEYGLAEKYNNNTPNDEENVTKSEAVKMIIEVILNEDNIDNYIDVDRSYYYENFIWVVYLEVTDVIDNNYINEENQMTNMTCIEIINILYDFIQKNKLINEDTEKIVEENNINIKNKQNYSQEELNKIKYLISYGIIPNDYLYKKEQTLTKKIFNEILVNFYEIRK